MATLRALTKRLVVGMMQAEAAREILTSPACAGAGMRHACFSASRSLNFCNLPVEVLGISENTTVRGHL